MVDTNDTNVGTQPAKKTATAKKDLAEPRKGTEVVTSEPAAGEDRKQPSFGISEGTRADLEQYGETTDPFTGKLLTQKDLP